MGDYNNNISYKLRDKLNLLTPSEYHDKSVLKDLNNSNNGDVYYQTGEHSFKSDAVGRPDIPLEQIVDSEGNPTSYKLWRKSKLQDLLSGMSQKKEMGAKIFRDAPTRNIIQPDGTSQLKKIITPAQQTYVKRLTNSLRTDAETFSKVRSMTEE